MDLVSLSLVYGLFPSEMGVTSEITGLQPTHVIEKAGQKNKREWKELWPTTTTAPSWKQLLFSSR